MGTLYFVDTPPSSLPHPQLKTEKKKKKKGLHGNSTLHCPSGKCTVDSSLSTPNTTWKKKHPLPPTKGRPHAFTP
jgi:hypothetical protein